MLLRRPMTPLMAAGLILLAQAPWAAGQTPEYVTVTPDMEVRRANEARVNTLFASPRTLGREDQIVLADYLTKYRFPMFTRTDPQSLGDLAKDRERFRTQFLWTPENGELRNEINRLVFSESQKLLAGNFHPAVKYNAVLLLGMIDERKADLSSPDQKSVPYPQATAALIQLAGDDNQDAMLRVGAWEGLLRHVQNELPNPDQTKAQIRALARQQAARPATEGEDDGPSWMRFQALKLLVSLGTEEEDLRLMAGAIAEPSTPMWFRLLATSALTEHALPENLVATLPQGVGRLGLDAYRTAAASVPIDEAAAIDARGVLASELESLSKCLLAAKAKNAATAPASLDAVQQALANSAARFKAIDTVQITSTNWVDEVNADLARLQAVIQAP